MKIAITGSSGLIGRALCKRLALENHQVLRLVRSKSSEENCLFWDPRAGILEKDELEGIDALIHLAGHNIVSKRWSEKEKERIYASRVQGTTLLKDTILELKTPPKSVLCASAIGYYSDRGEEIITEETEAGDDFLANVCRDWEKAAEGLSERGIRLIIQRIGVVLSTKGGALHKMLTPFKLGLGGVIGSGEQYMSWITLDDLIDAIYFLLTTPEASGVFNLVSPNPVSNRVFTKALGQALGRPTVLPLPAAIARLALGEMADALLLVSSRCSPKRLLELGFGFQHDTIEKALSKLLK